MKLQCWKHLEKLTFKAPKFRLCRKSPDLLPQCEHQVVGFDMRLVRCLSFTVQSAAEDSDVRTEPRNSPADINPMCLARPRQVGLEPEKERRRVRWQRLSLPSPAGTAWSQAHNPYPLFPCVYLFLTLLLRHTYCMQIWGGGNQIKIRLSHICQYLLFF